MDANDASPQVQATTVISALILLACTAASQRSYVADLCGLSSPSACSVYRLSPCVCLFDLAADVEAVYRFFRPGPTSDKLEKQEMDAEQPLRTASLAQWVLIVCAALPAAIVIFLCRGIPAAQICAGIYVAAILSHALSGHRNPTNADLAQAVLMRFNMAFFHVLILSSMWMVPLWQLLTDVTEATGHAADIAIVKICSLGGLLLLPASALVMPIIPHSWRIPNGILMMLQPLITSQLITGYRKVDGKVVPKQAWEFSTHFYCGATLAMIMPVLLTTSLAVPLLWLSKGEISGVLVEQAEAVETVEIPEESPSYWSQVKREAWRIVTNGIYCYNSFVACFGWCTRLRPDAQRMFFSVLAFLTLVMYYGIVFDGKNTSMPSWLHTMLQPQVFSAA